MTLNRVRPYIYMHSLGKFVLGTPVRRMGHNDSVGATWETVWCKSSLYTYLTTASKLKIYSSDVQDAQNGTGAKTIFVKGLDANYNIIFETISTHATNGTTSVSSVKNYLRVFTARVVLSGTNGTNIGDITVEDAAGVITLAYIEADEGKSLQCIWTVPAGKTVTILRWAYAELKAKISEIALFVRPYNESWYIAKTKYLKDMVEDSLLTLPLEFKERTDIEIRAWATGGEGQISATIEGYYL